MKKTIAFPLFFAAFAMSCGNMHAQKEEEPLIKPQVMNACSDVKNQGYSGTCWSFACISFLESEVKRTKGIDVDLSEWFIVRNIYPEKVRNYLRLEGNMFLSAGGQTQDVLWVMEHVGLAPEEALPGPMHYGIFNSEKLDTAVMDFVKGLRWDKYGIHSFNWETRLDTLLNSQLGASPQKFKYNNTNYTPAKFRDELGLKADDYIQVTSFNHHSYYKPFALESKYNWSMNQYHNIPLDEYIEVLDHALDNGYTAAVNIDVTELSFTPSNRQIVVSPIKNVDQIKRQNLYESGKTRVDHIMHIVGYTVIDGKKHYLTKNSWGTIGPLKGYIYLTEDYIRAKSMSHTLHKDALPDNTKVALGLK